MFGDDRLRGLGVAGRQILAFPIDFDCRPYNTLALPCECVIKGGVTPAVQVLASSPKDVLKSTVFSCRRKAASDCSSLAKDGREFQAQSAVTGNANYLCFQSLYN